MRGAALEGPAARGHRPHPSAHVSRWLPGPVTAQPPGDMGLCPPSVQPPWVGAWDLQGVPHLPSFLTSAVGLPSEAGWGSTVPVPVPLLTGLVHLGDTEIGEAKEQGRNEGEQQVHVLRLHHAGVTAGEGDPRSCRLEAAAGRTWYLRPGPRAGRR